MRPTLSVVTLGVRDLGRARSFYEALGWSSIPAEAGSTISFFELDGVVLSLYGWDDLAESATCEFLLDRKGKYSNGCVRFK